MNGQKGKRIAVWGLVVLAAVVAVCMFFSGTVRTITTAKVKIIAPRNGKLTQSVTLTGKLRFTGSQDVFLAQAEGFMLEIKSVSVQAGQEVRGGDVLFSAAVADYESKLATLRGEYDTANQQLQALVQKDMKLRNTEQAWAEAYVALTDATAAAEGVAEVTRVSNAPLREQEVDNLGRSYAAGRRKPFGPELDLAALRALRHELIEALHP